MQMSLFKNKIMKKLFKTFALIALTSIGSFANEAKTTASNFEIGMYTIINTSSVRLLLEKEKGVYLTINLKNEKGEVIFKEYVSKIRNHYEKEMHSIVNLVRKCVNY